MTIGVRHAEQYMREMGGLSGFHCIWIRKLRKQYQWQENENQGKLSKKDIPDDQTRALWSWGVLFSELRWKCFCCIEMPYISLSWRELSFSDVHSAFFLSVGLSSETKMTYFGPLEWIIKLKFKLEFPLFRSIKIRISVFKSIGSTNWLSQSVQVLPSCILSCSTGIWTNKRWLKRKGPETGIYSRRKHIFEAAMTPQTGKS